MLAHSIHGSVLNPNRVAFVHGFTQTRNSWSPVLDRLPDNLLYITIDAPGHGESSLETGDLQQTATEVVDTVGSAVLCGYSMGARMCLLTALQYPSIIKGMVLISGTAGIDDRTERRLRRKSDRKLARHILEVGVDTFVDEWLSQAMFRGMPIDQVDRAQRKTNTSMGLANNLRTTGVGTQRPVWDRLAEIQIPVLIIAGANDSKFADIAIRLQQGIKSSHLEIVANAGHAVHYEQPKIVSRIIETWLTPRFSN
ncbi:MAG: alpha/beta fold hydrolase [Ilumatobacteraceae bacterium]